jgi:hypothetical protein
MNEKNPEVHQEHHLPQKNLWQRWMDWSGSFLFLSILIHVLFIAGATLIVVQVVNSRKEKLKFTAPPPSANAAAEHKVKPTKKTNAAAPEISKRITSTAANASIALPAMELNSSSPDVMASVMSGMGASGLGSGSAGAGLAAMPVGGLTAFGFKGAGGGGLKGHFYDLKQTPDRQPTTIQAGGGGSAAHFSVLAEFFKDGWDDKVLDKYYKAKDSMITFQVYIPNMDAKRAPEAFGVEKEVKPSHWVIVYKGNVTAPRDGTFRFVGFADDVVAVRFDGQNVFVSGIGIKPIAEFFTPTTPPVKLQRGAPNPNDIGTKGVGNWFSVQAGKTYPIEVLISEVPGGIFYAWLQIEEKFPDKPYPHRTFPGIEKYLAYPLFQVKKGVPITERKEELTMPPNLKAAAKWKPSETAPELAPDPVIFNSK